MPTDRLTDPTVLAAVQARPMTGDTITAVRDYLACSAPTLAELLDVPADKILALEAAGPRGAVPEAPSPTTSPARSPTTSPTASTS